jgi:hypothetical protein
MGALGVSIPPAPALAIAGISDTIRRTSILIPKILFFDVIFPTYLILSMNYLR